jgi:Na+/melibiose symporter-like transporter
LFVSLVPAAVLLLSVPVVVKYPITRQRYAEIRAALEARHAE